MGGSPSERKMPKNTKDNDKTQRYIQNKKGRTSFFLYHRTAPTATVQKPQLPTNTTGTNLQQIAAPKKVSTNASKSQEPLPMLLEMEVVSSSSDSEESDDNFTSTPDAAGIFTSKTPTIRRIRRRSRTTAVIMEAANAAVARGTVEPHVATRVQFANVEIRSYPITIGDHPCCTIGCPIALDWDYTTQDVVSLQEYEAQKYGSDNAVTTPTKLNELRISPEERVELLIQSSHLSELEIRRASRKFHRNKNCSLRQCERIHETFFHCRKDPNEEDSEEEEDDEDNESRVVVETDDDDSTTSQSS